MSPYFSILFANLEFHINEKIQISKRNLDSYNYELCWEKWVVMDSNHRRHRQQIYSLPHLATLVTTLAFQKRLQRYCFYFVPPNL